MKIVFSTMFFLLLVISCAVDNGSDSLDVNYLSPKGVGYFTDTTIRIDSVSNLNYNALSELSSSYNLLWLGKSETEIYSPSIAYSYEKTTDSVIDLRLSLFTDSTFLPILSDTIFATITYDSNEFLAPLIYVEDTSLSAIEGISVIDEKGYIFELIYTLPAEIYPYFHNYSDTSETGAFILTINGNQMDTLVPFYVTTSSSFTGKDVRPRIEIVSNSIDTLDSLGGAIVSQINVNKIAPITTFSAHSSSFIDDGEVHVGNRRNNSFFFYKHNEDYLTENFIKNIYVEFYYKETNNKFYSDTTYNTILGLYYYGSTYSSTHFTDSDVKDSILPSGEAVVFVSKDITKWGIDMVNYNDSLKIKADYTIPYLFDVTIYDFRIRVEESIYVEPEGNL